jgi:hypothetical protein
MISPTDISSYTEYLQTELQDLITGKVVYEEMGPYNSGDLIWKSEDTSIGMCVCISVLSSDLEESSSCIRDIAGRRLGIYGGISTSPYTEDLIKNTLHIWYI